MRFSFLHIAFVFAVLISAATSIAQVPVGSTKTSSPKDSAIIFQSPRPLLEETSASANMISNSIGFSGMINDFGFGVGFYYRRSLTEDLSGLIIFDIGTAKDAKEFGLADEIMINRIYVMPLMASLQYRLFNGVLGDGLRPYVTAGAGPAFIATTDGSQDFFVALGHPKLSTTFGGFFGVGANFGSDPKTTFGASLKYYIIPYPAPGIESTQGHFLTNFSAAALTITYGFNF